MELIPEVGLDTLCLRYRKFISALRFEHPGVGKGKPVESELEAG